MIRSVLIWAGLVLLTASQASARAERVDAVPGERLPPAFEDVEIVIPLVPADGVRRDAWVPARAPQVTSADGAALESSVRFIARVPERVEMVDDGHGHGGGMAGVGQSSAWMPESPHWVVQEFEARDVARRVDALIARDALGGWFLIVDAPPGVRLDGLIVDGERFPVRPMSRNAYTPRREIVNPSGADWSVLGGMLMPMVSDADERWRLRLLEDRVSPGVVWGGAGRPEGAIRDAALEARATFTEQRWRAALALVESGDAQTAIDLVRALTSVVRLPSGVVVPAWPVENDDHAQLLDALLAPGLKPEDAARRARGYLASIAGACLTVLDDNQGILALTEVRGQTLEATVAGRQIRLAPFQTDISVIPESPDGAGMSVAEVRAGAMGSSAAALNGAVPVRPPGFRIGPTYEPFTLAQWRTARPLPATGDRACAALIQRGPIGAGEEVGGGAWQVYIECAAPHEGAAPGDEVVLYVGDGLRRVDSGGTIRDGAGDEVGRFPTMFDHGRWWAIVPLPDDAIEPDGTLLIAMERRNDSGVRATWPRPLLPGDDRPAPVRLDLNTWGGGVDAR